jgi:hypothetical protein
LRRITDVVNRSGAGDGHSAGVPAGRGEAGDKWPWMQEA